MGRGKRKMQKRTIRKRRASLLPLDPHPEFEVPTRSISNRCWWDHSAEMSQDSRSKQSSVGAHANPRWLAHGEQITLCLTFNMPRKLCQPKIRNFGDNAHAMDFGVWLLWNSPSFCEQWIQKKHRKKGTQKLSYGATTRQVCRHTWGTLLRTSRKYWRTFWGACESVFTCFYNRKCLGIHKYAFLLNFGMIMVFLRERGL